MNDRIISMKYYYTTEGERDAPCGLHEMRLGNKRVFNLKEKERPTEKGEKRDSKGQRGSSKDQIKRSQKMERWLRSNIYPGKRKRWKMIWAREMENLSFAIPQFLHPHLFPLWTTHCKSLIFSFPPRTVHCSSRSPCDLTSSPLVHI